MLGGDIGIRLKALEYWQCAEVGLIAPSPSSSLTDDASLKLVLVEAMPGVGKLSSTIKQFGDSVKTHTVHKIQKLYLVMSIHCILFIIADKSQVNTFLHGHGGPGIQHIALHTPTMTATVHHMTKYGVEFRRPPPVYYQEVN